MVDLQNLNSKNTHNSETLVFKWKPSCDFDDSLFQKKKSELSELIELFANAKAKRKAEKPDENTEQDERKSSPFMGEKFDHRRNTKKSDQHFAPNFRLFKLPSESDTESETLESLCFPVELGERQYFIPKKADYSLMDFSNDGFDVIPELLELLPSYDPQAKSYQEGNILRDDKRFNKLPKRKACALLSASAFHKWDPEYIEDKKLSVKELKKRNEIRIESSRAAWNEITKTEIKKEFSQHSAFFDQKQKMLKNLADGCFSHLRRKYEIPCIKDIHSCARKIVYEMETYWRKVDRDTNDTKKKKTKDVITERKKIHSQKEVKRQSQRLNFLLRQTEIFSHFIGARMGIKLNKNKNEDPNEKVSSGALIEGCNSNNGESNKDVNQNENMANETDDSKAAKAAIDFMNRRKNATRTFEKKIVEISGNKAYEKTSEENLSEMDLLNPSTMPSQTNIQQPNMFVGTLKSYQMKGLNWLVNLYDHSINGILADEMGLGKTIQSIAFIAHLCEVENLWGPYLVVAPNSVVHNWCYEFEQFTPEIRVLPYWGQQKDRETLRKFWKPHFLYSSDGEFHVMVTSYSTFQTDERFFKKMKWQFIILDEAQAIKNSTSQRWKSLLSLECRNRLLLTGTPIQNSMAELWSLLHYIMPTIFQKHQDFKEWFSKNIEDHAEGKSQKLNLTQLQRLHMILKPFMLRRIKSDVEHEMAPKKEIVIKCDLSPRQKRLYNAIKTQIKNGNSNENKILADKDLYNAVMQFRKVCNHPEIYQKRLKTSPFLFKTDQKPEKLLSVLPKDDYRNVMYDTDSPIHISAPRITSSWEKKDDFLVYLDERKRKMDLLRRFSIFTTERIDSSLYKQNSNNAFAFNYLLGMTSEELESAARGDPVYRWILLGINRSEKKKWTLSTDGHRLINPLRNIELIDKYDRLLDYPKLITSAFIPKCQAAPPKLEISRRDMEFERREKTWEKALLLGNEFEGFDSLRNHLKFNSTSNLFLSPLSDQIIVIDRGLLSPLTKVFGTNRSKIEKLPRDVLLTDCGKLASLDKLLAEKKRHSHRVLIFSQMTKLLDILEDYCHYRKHKFLRLDGSTQINDRTIMVKQFQRDASVFIFLLSTRAGGLGINLTAADTVIFYDNDWNPTMDAQAMDRVHRIGQKKQVTVYRIICRGTVEERVWRVAQQKFRIQKSVYSGGFKFGKEKRKRGEEELADTKVFKAKQLRRMILEDESGD